MRRNWATDAISLLQAGETVRVQPRGDSMTGLINDGDWVTLTPVESNLQVGDIVLAQVKGRHYTHFVLHMILECRENLFLIGSRQGRVDGWVPREAILGKVEGR